MNVQQLYAAMSTEMGNESVPRRCCGGAPSWVLDYKEGKAAYLEYQERMQHVNITLRMVKANMANVSETAHAVMDRVPNRGLDMDNHFERMQAVVEGYRNAVLDGSGAMDIVLVRDEAIRVREQLERVKAAMAVQTPAETFEACLALVLRAGAHVQMLDKYRVQLHAYWQGIINDAVAVRAEKEAKKRNPKTRRRNK